MSRSPSTAPVEAVDLTLSIDRLSVEGVGPASARRLGAALERGLDRLLVERGVPSSFDGSGGSAVDLTTVDVEIPGQGLDIERLGPERAGALLAEALWTRLDRASGDPDRAVGSAEDSGP